MGLIKKRRWWVAKMGKLREWKLRKEKYFLHKLSYETLCLVQILYVDTSPYSYIFAPAPIGEGTGQNIYNHFSFAPCAPS